MSICNRTPTSTEEARQFIAERMQSYTGQIEVLPGPPETPPPVKRSDWIDPDLKLKREVTVKPKPWELTPAREASIHRARNKREMNAQLRQSLPDSEAPIQVVAARYGMSRSTLQARMRKGMTLEQALSMPVDRRIKCGQLEAKQ